MWVWSDFVNDIDHFSWWHWILDMYPMILGKDLRINNWIIVSTSFVMVTPYGRLDYTGCKLPYRVFPACMGVHVFNSYLTFLQGDSHICDRSIYPVIVGSCVEWLVSVRAL